MFCKCFFPVCGLPFLNNNFQEKFYILMKSNLAIPFFYALCLLCPSLPRQKKKKKRKICVTHGHEDLKYTSSIYHSLRSCIVTLQEYTSIFFLLYFELFLSCLISYICIDMKFKNGKSQLCPL